MFAPQATRPAWVLTLCFLITALNVMDRQVLAITASAIQAEFGLSDAELGLLTGFAFVVMHVIVGIPVSWLADRSNRRNVIALGVIAWSALTAATGLARSYGQIFAARIGVGVGEAVGSGPVQSLLADYFPVGRRGTAYAVNGSGGNLGAFVALLLGGFLVEAVGWRATFFVFGAPGLVVALLLFLSVEEPTRSGLDGDDGSGRPLLESMGRVARTPCFALLTLSASFNQFTNYGFLFFLPTAMMRLHGLDAGAAGSSLALCQAAPTFAGVLASGWLVDRLGRRDLRWHLRVPALASCLAAPLAVVFLSIDALAPALAVCAMSSFLSTMWLATGNSALQSVVTPSVRATAFSMMLFVSSLFGLGLGPAFVGWASDALSSQYGAEGLRYALMAAAGVQVLGGLAHGLASRRYREAARPA
jgi:MFS family permease